ncbi:MAG: malate dehydrogenase [Acidimicrobiia bacterium]
MKVTVVGAGNYGSTLAKRLAEQDLADEVVMFDIVEGLPQGLALDMNQARPVERYRTRVVGTDDYRDTSGSEVVVITAGSPRKPGMSRMDLLEINAKIVQQVTEQVMEHSAEPVLIVVTNPLDEMTTLAADVSGLPRGKVMGQAGMLDSARFAYFISEATGADILEVEALTLGSHGDTMVPVPSQCRAGGKPLTDLLEGSQIADVVAQTREGGAEIVGLLKKGSAYFAPAAAAAAMVQAVLQGSDQVMPVCAWTTGQYGIADVYLGVPTRLGARGVEEIIELPLEEDELRALREAAEAVRAKVGELGEVRLA